MDGTLVDTEPYWIRAEHELVAAHGGSWSEADAHLLVGNAHEVSAGMIIERTGLALSVEEVVTALLGRVIELVGERLPWRPGARELLAELVAEGVPCLLVTMSWRSLADEVVKSLPGGSFRALVTGDEVSHGKPHPEPYLAAARLVSADPRDCVAIEDSPTGVRSATAAGVPTIAVPHIVPVPEIPGAVRLDSLQGVGAQDLLRLVSSMRTQEAEYRPPAVR
jgi:HAD superfamily hydrolase (TIGR01509 family)